jgi:hypothetical protein
MKGICTILLIASAAHAADVLLWTTEKVIVGNSVRFSAMQQADRIFAGIGVSLRWAKAMPSASCILART